MRRGEWHSMQDVTGIVERWWLPHPYSMSDVIGRGSFGVVVEVTQAQSHEREPLPPRALKRVQLLTPPKSKSPLVLHTTAAHVLRRHFREITLLRRLQYLDHPHLVKFIDAWTDSKVDGGGDESSGSHGTRRRIPAVYMLFERLCLNSSIHGPLSLGPAPLSLTEVAKVLRQLFSALRALHDNGLVHRDVKPQNILFTADGVLRLIDFGMARAICPSDTNAGASGLATEVAVTPLQSNQAAGAPDTDVASALPGPPTAEVQDQVVCDGPSNRNAGGRVRRYSMDVVSRSYRAPELLVNGLLYGTNPVGTTGPMTHDDTGLLTNRATAIDVWSAGCILGEMLVRSLGGKDTHQGHAQEAHDANGTIAHGSSTPARTASSEAVDDAEGLPLALFPRRRCSRTSSGVDSENCSTTTSVMSLDTALGEQSDGLRPVDADVAVDITHLEMKDEDEREQDALLDSGPSEQLSSVLRVVGMPADTLALWQASARRASTSVLDDVMTTDAHPTTPDQTTLQFLDRLKPRRSHLPARFHAVGDPHGIDLLMRLLSVDPARRPSCAEALEHPFLRSSLAQSEVSPKYLPDDVRRSIDALSAVAEACDDPRKLARLIQREADAFDKPVVARHETNIE